MSEQLELPFTGVEQTSEPYRTSIPYFAQQLRVDPEVEEWRKHCDTLIAERNRLMEDNAALIQTVKILSRGC